jgi:hypothetical protein
LTPWSGSTRRSSRNDAAGSTRRTAKPHIVSVWTTPRPCHSRAFGGGTLPRKELHEAAKELSSSQAGLIVAGEPTIEKGLDKAIGGAARVVKRSVDASTDEIASELQDALKS